MIGLLLLAWFVRLDDTRRGGAKWQKKDVKRKKETMKKKIARFFMKRRKVRKEGRRKTGEGKGVHVCRL